MMTESIRSHAAFEQPEHKAPGALLQKDGSVLWRLWAPQHQFVRLMIEPAGRLSEHSMEADRYGYHVFRGRELSEGDRYAFRLADDSDLPDPASRWQPDGVHAPSALYFPQRFRWSDGDWKGIARADLVIYELHVGTFTEEGTLEAVIPRLEELRELGVTAIELMPVAQFPGDRNWGYDGVYPYAVQNSYGGPRGLQQLVDAAHRCGLGVILDVVYNHFGPEGNYLGRFGPYFTDRYHTPWGDAVNYDGPHCDSVRQYILENARMWVRDFHVDGLRLDAVHAIYDCSARHILAELQECVQQVGRQQRRTVHVMAESNQNDVRLIDPVDRHGFGLDAVWNDDFHHSVHTLLSGDREGYYQDYGQPAHLAKSLQDVFVYDGCFSPFRKRRHGSRVEDRDRTRFVVCVHNHDQIGNRALGDRPASYLPHSAQRLACGLLMISPSVPLLFMGEEYGERRPFPFFCSYSGAKLIEAVRHGRREEFAALDFQWTDAIPDPQAPATFASAKLSWRWEASTWSGQLRQLYRDLLAARRTWRSLQDRQHTRARLAPPPDNSGREEPTVLLVQRGTNPGVLVVANLSSICQAYPDAVTEGKELLLSTESVAYGGTRETRVRPDRLLPHELLILGHDR